MKFRQVAKKIALPCRNIHLLALWSVDRERARKKEKSESEGNGERRCICYVGTERNILLWTIQKSDLFDSSLCYRRPCSSIPLHTLNTPLKKYDSKPVKELELQKKKKLAEVETVHIKHEFRPLKTHNKSLKIQPAV
jgi:hypothetical protein